MFTRSALKVAAIGSPPQQEEGIACDIKENAAKPPLLERTGWCGKKFLDHTTPSARAEVASRLLLIVQPPLLLLRREFVCKAEPRLQNSSSVIVNLVVPASVSRVFENSLER